MDTEARIPMIATTIINSIKVKPCCLRIFVSFWIEPEARMAPDAFQ